MVSCLVYILYLVFLRTIFSIGQSYLCNGEFHTLVCYADELIFVLWFRVVGISALYCQCSRVWIIYLEEIFSVYIFISPSAVSVAKGCYVLLSWHKQYSMLPLGPYHFTCFPNWFNRSSG